MEQVFPKKITSPKSNLDGFYKVQEQADRAGGVLSTCLPIQGNVGVALLQVRS